MNGSSMQGSCASNSSADLPSSDAGKTQRVLQKNPNKRKKKKSRAKKPPKNNYRRKVMCKFFLNGYCKKGGDCKFGHNAKETIGTLCLLYARGGCPDGKKCKLMHEEFPCRYFHTGFDCWGGDKCRFSHKPLDKQSAALLKKHLDDYELKQEKMQQTKSYCQENEVQSPVNGEKKMNFYVDKLESLTKTPVDNCLLSDVEEKFDGSEKHVTVPNLRGTIEGQQLETPQKAKSDDTRKNLCPLMNDSALLPIRECSPTVIVPEPKMNVVKNGQITSFEGLGLDREDSDDDQLVIDESSASQPLGCNETKSDVANPEKTYGSLPPNASVELPAVFTGHDESGSETTFESALFESVHSSESSTSALHCDNDRLWELAKHKEISLKCPVKEVKQERPFNKEPLLVIKFESGCISTPIEEKFDTTVSSVSSTQIVSFATTHNSMHCATQHTHSICPETSIDCSDMKKTTYIPLKGTSESAKPLSAVTVGTLSQAREEPQAKKLSAESTISLRRESAVPVNALSKAIGKVKDDPSVKKRISLKRKSAIAMNTLSKARGKVKADPSVKRGIFKKKRKRALSQTGSKAREGTAEPSAGSGILFKRERTLRVDTLSKAEVKVKEEPSAERESSLKRKRTSCCPVEEKPPLSCPKRSSRLIKRKVCPCCDPTHNEQRGQSIHVVPVGPASHLESNQSGIKKSPNKESRNTPTVTDVHISTGAGQSMMMSPCHLESNQSGIKKSPKTSSVIIIHVSKQADPPTLQPPSELESIQSGSKESPNAPSSTEVPISIQADPSMLQLPSQLESIQAGSMESPNALSSTEVPISTQAEQSMLQPPLKCKCNHLRSIESPSTPSSTEDSTASHTEPLQLSDFVTYMVVARLMQQAERMKSPTGLLTEHEHSGNGKYCKVCYDKIMKLKESGTANDIQKSIIEIAELALKAKKQRLGPGGLLIPFQPEYCTSLTRSNAESESAPLH